MSALLSMILSVLIWSLYPLAASKGLEEMNSIAFIFIISLFACGGSIILSFLYLFATKQIKKAFNAHKNLPSKAYAFIIFSGFGGVACNGLFIYALTLSNKAGVSIIYEAWPIIALIASPLLMRKRWKKVSLSEFLICLVPLVGVAFIVLYDKNINLPSFISTNQIDSRVDFMVFIGYALALIGGYMCALMAVTKACYSEYLETFKDDFAVCLMGEVLSRAVSLAFAGALFFIFPVEVNGNNLDYASGLFIGIVVLIFGGGLYNLALLKAETATIHILYYLVPLLAVLWLHLFDEAELHLGIFIGGAIVILTNLYLGYTQKRASYEHRKGVIYGENNIEK